MKFQTGSRYYNNIVEYINKTIRLCAEHQSPKDRVTSERLYVVVRLVHNRFSRKVVSGYTSQDRHFHRMADNNSLWSYNKSTCNIISETFSDFERVMSLSYRAS
jgi:hypothetical protein